MKSTHCEQNYQIAAAPGLENPDFRDNFLEVARRVYKNDPVWVPEEKWGLAEKMQGYTVNAHTQLVIAFKDSIPVARAVALLTPGAMDQAGESQGWIAFFEAEKSQPGAAKAVLSHSEDFLKRLGAKSVVTPKADNQLSGLLIKGFDHPQTVMTNHNPDYYLDLFLDCDYRVSQRTVSFYFTRRRVFNFPLVLPGFTTRTFDNNNPDYEIAIFNRLQNAIFQGRPGYIPRTVEEDRELFRSLHSFIDPALIIIAEDRKGHPAGILVCLPDAYQALRGEQVTRARIVTIGALPHLQRRGLGVLMGAHLMKNLLAKGYQSAEASWILKENVPPQNLAKKFRAQPGREFALLGKDLAD